MYTFNWALTAFRSESYIGSATALPDKRGQVAPPTDTIIAKLWIQTSTPLSRMVWAEHRSSGTWTLYIRATQPMVVNIEIDCFVL